MKIRKGKAGFAKGLNFEFQSKSGGFFSKEKTYIGGFYSLRYCCCLKVGQYKINVNAGVDAGSKPVEFQSFPGNSKGDPLKISFLIF